LACKDNRRGIVDFVDAGIDIDDQKNYWDGRGFWKKNDPERHFDKINIGEYIKTYVMTTKEFASRYRHRYDYVYIDGDHSYEGVKLDYELFWPRLNRGGLMLLHDISEKGKVGEGVYGVWRLWQEIKPKGALELPMASGLGILRIE
jgi:predicted O-methyltransferase YrrM